MREEQDLGGKIASATLAAISRLLAKCDVALAIADPEPVLRGVAAAYVALAQALPGGLDEARLLLGLLALELTDTDKRQHAEVRST